LGSRTPLISSKDVDLARCYKCSSLRNRFPGNAKALFDVMPEFTPSKWGSGTLFLHFSEMGHAVWRSVALPARHWIRPPGQCSAGTSVFRCGHEVFRRYARRPSAADPNDPLPPAVPRDELHNHFRNRKLICAHYRRRLPLLCL